MTRFLTLLVGLALLATACSKATNSNSTNGSSTNSNSTVNSTSSSSSSSSSTSSSGSPASSPIAAYKAFQEANKKKDYEGVKRRFSKASLEMITDEAKKKNQTLDEYVKQQVDSGKQDEEVTNEKITGDTATIDLKDKTSNSTITLPMVMEDGEWKIAYDKFVKQMNEAFDKMSKELPKSKDDTGTDNDNK
ncbi:MAG TPA: hypothetical protein VGC64_09870 [Pyrinomonadaceae bacterium]